MRIRNTSSEPLAFAGFPILPPGATAEVSEEAAELLGRNPNVAIETDTVEIEPRDTPKRRRDTEPQAEAPKEPDAETSVS